MANLGLHALLSQFVYPLGLTGLGVLGNAYVLGNDVKDVQKDVKDIQKDIKGLLVRQADQEAQTTAIMQKYMKGCGK